MNKEKEFQKYLSEYTEKMGELTERERVVAEEFFYYGIYVKTM